MSRGTRCACWRYRDLLKNSPFPLYALSRVEKSTVRERSWGVLTAESTSAQAATEREICNLIRKTLKRERHTGGVLIQRKFCLYMLWNAQAAWVDDGMLAGGHAVSN